MDYGSQPSTQKLTIFSLLSIFYFSVILIPVTCQNGVNPFTDVIRQRDIRLVLSDVNNGGEGEDSSLAAWQIMNPRLDNSIITRDAAFIQRRRQRCSNKFQIAHGRRRIMEQGSLVRFRCDHGYILFGATVAACVNGQWSEPTPVCVAGGCRRPPISLGISARALFGGAAIIFECNPGFRMIGEGTLVCNGIRWNGTAPSCQRLTPSTTTTTAPPLPTSTTTHTLEHGESDESDENLGEDPKWRKWTWGWSKVETTETEPQEEFILSTTPNQVTEGQLKHEFSSPDFTPTPIATSSKVELPSQETLAMNQNHIEQITKESVMTNHVTENTITMITTHKLAGVEIETTTADPNLNPTPEIPEIINNRETPAPFKEVTPSIPHAKPTENENVAITSTSSTIKVPNVFPSTDLQTTTAASHTTPRVLTSTLPWYRHAFANSTNVTTLSTATFSSGIVWSKVQNGNTTNITSIRFQQFTTPAPRFFPPRIPTRLPKIRCFLDANLRTTCVNSDPKFNSYRPNGTIPIMMRPSGPRTFNLTANNTFNFQWNRSKIRNFPSITIRNVSIRTRRPAIATTVTMVPTKIMPTEEAHVASTATLGTTNTPIRKETTKVWTTELSDNNSRRKVSLSATTTTINYRGTSTRESGRGPEISPQFDNTIDQILQETKEKERINEIDKEKERGNGLKNDVEPKHELITPFKLDEAAGNAGHEKSGGSSILLTLGSILSIGTVGFVIGFAVYYCWRKNKGISRSTRRDSDGENLPVHLDVEEEFVYFGNNRW